MFLAGRNIGDVLAAYHGQGPMPPALPAMHQGAHGFHHDIH